MIPLVAESLRVSWASRVVSILIALLAFAVPLTALGIAGRNIEVQRAILARVDGIGARVVTITSTGAPIIPSDAIDRLARLSGIDWIVGLGPTSDVRSRQQAGPPVPMREIRQVHAPMSFSVRPTDGIALVSSASARRAGLAGAFSVLDPGRLRVVGWFTAAPPLQALEQFVLVPNTSPDLRLERIIVAVLDVAYVDQLVGWIPILLGEDASAGTTVDQSPALLDARNAVRDEVTRQDRILVVAILAVSMMLSGAVVLAGTLAARRDFGRRRALGASRGQLLGLVVAATSWPAAVGVGLGVAAGYAWLSIELGHPPSWAFPVSVGVLAFLGIMISAAIPAGIAATRDPLKVLRVP